MSNPFEFREAMNAAFGFSDKTIEQVLAEQRQREKQNSTSKTGSRVRPVPTTQAKPNQSEVDKLNDILAKAKPRPTTDGE